MEQKDYHYFAIASTVLGVFNLCAWFLPICGLPLSIIGLILGIVAINSSQRGFAIAGIIMGSIGLLLSLVNAVLGAYLGLTGQLF